MSWHATTNRPHAAAEYIKAHFKDKKIAIVNDKQSYSKGLADNVEKELSDAGIKPAFVSTINPGERDYSSLVTRLKENNIDFLFYGGYHTEAGLIIRQMREQKIEYGCDGRRCFYDQGIVVDHG